jgi:hypothetical protein
MKEAKLRKEGKRDFGEGEISCTLSYPKMLNVLKTPSYSSIVTDKTDLLAGGNSGYSGAIVFYSKIALGR